MHSLAHKCKRPAKVIQPALAGLTPATRSLMAKATLNNITSRRAMLAGTAALPAPGAMAVQS